MFTAEFQIVKIKGIYVYLGKFGRGVTGNFCLFSIFFQEQ